MADIGTATANQFTLPAITPPNEQEMAQQIQAQGPSPELMGEMPSGLENVQGVTRELYHKWAKVRSFAQNMWNNHRVNVTAPDFSNPVAVKAHDAFNKAMADLYYSSDVLQQSEKIRQSLASIMAAPDTEVDPHPGRETQVGDIINYGMTATVAQAIDIANKVYRTKAEAEEGQRNIQGLLEASQGDLKRMQEEGLDTREKQKEIERLEQLSTNFQPHAPQYDWEDRESLKMHNKWLLQKDKIEPTYERWSLIRTGLDPTYEVSDRKTPDGGKYMVTDRMNGRLFGESDVVGEDGRITRQKNKINLVYFDPTTSELIFTYSHGGEERIEGDLALTDAVVKYLTHNTSGLTEADVNAFLEGKTQYEGIIDPNNPMHYIKLDQEEIFNRSQALEQKRTESKADVAAKDTEVSKTPRASWLFRFMTLTEFPTTIVTPEETDLKIKVTRKNDGTFKIKNGTEISKSLVGSDLRDGDILTEPELQRLLEKVGFYGTDFAKDKGLTMEEEVEKDTSRVKQDATSGGTIPLDTAATGQPTAVSLEQLNDPDYLAKLQAQASTPSGQVSSEVQQSSQPRQDSMINNRELVSMKIDIKSILNEAGVKGENIDKVIKTITPKTTRMNTNYSKVDEWVDSTLAIKSIMEALLPTTNDKNKIRNIIINLGDVLGQKAQYTQSVDALIENVNWVTRTFK